MDIKALTGARIAVAKLAGNDGCWHHADTALAAQVQDFLETLPAVFAELEAARRNITTFENQQRIDATTLITVRDLLAAERAVSDERLLKIEKLRDAPIVSVNYSNTPTDTLVEA